MARAFEQLFERSPRPQCPRYDLPEPPVSELTCIEICAGAGGQAIGLEKAGFAHTVAVEIDPDACETLRINRADAWGEILEKDVKNFDATPYKGEVDLFAGGVPCPPFSIAGKQLGSEDERDLFPRALELIEQCEPKAVMLENVRGLATERFTSYRESIEDALKDMDYEVAWQVLHASEYGVPQLRPRFILVALKQQAFDVFEWPTPFKKVTTVGQALKSLMAKDGWELANEWAKQANSVAPTLVGGSRKHGGPDLGPTRARAQWLKLGVDGRGLANELPQPGSHQNLKTDPPRLTLEMAARVQGFPADWKFFGRKTAAYRQIGNAFPPPVAEAVGKQIRAALEISGMVELSDATPSLELVKSA
jgi:DNA (cytosine-5)-methyltransferase 1